MHVVGNTTSDITRLLPALKIGYHLGDVHSAKENSTIEHRLRGAGLPDHQHACVRLLAPGLLVANHIDYALNQTCVGVNAAICAERVMSGIQHPDYLQIKHCSLRQAQAKRRLLQVPRISANSGPERVSTRKIAGQQSASCCRRKEADNFSQSWVVMSCCHACYWRRKSSTNFCEAGM